MTRPLTVAMTAACLVLVSLSAPVTSSIALAESPTADRGSTAEPRISPRSGVPADGIVGSWSDVGGGLNDPVYALTFWDDTLVAGGEFDFTLDGGVELNNIGAFSAADDTWVGLGAGVPGLDDDVNALTEWDGDLVVGGAFDSSANDDTLNRIGVLSTPSSSWRGLGQGDDTGLNGDVRALTVWDDSLIAGGNFDFTFDGGIALNYVGAFNDADDTWMGVGPLMSPGLNDPVLALSTWDASLVAGGEFTTTDDSGVDLNYVGAFNVVDDTWVGLPAGNPGMPRPIGPVTAPLVRAAVTFAGQLVVGGDFTDANEQADPETGLDRIGVYSMESQSWVDLGGGVDDPVYALAVDETRSLIYAGGDFEDADERADGVAVWDAGIEQWVSFVWGTADDSVGISSAASVRALAIDDSAVYVGGDFSDADPGVSGTAGIARWTWNPPQGDGSYTGAEGQRIRIVGEGFIGMTADDTPTIGGEEVDMYTRISATEIALTVPPGSFTGAPIVVSAIGGSAVVGTFTSQQAPASLGDWSPLHAGLSSDVNSLVLWDGELVAGGAFECALTWFESSCNGDDTLNYIGAYSPTDDTWTPLGPGSAPGLDDEVRVVGLWDDSLVAGGFFADTSDGGVNLEMVGVYAPADDTWVALGSGPGVPSGVVYALTQWDDSLVVGGSWNPYVDLFPPRGPLTPMGVGLDYIVYALVAHDDTVYAGGDFGSPGGPPHRVSAFQANTASWLELGSGLNDTVEALAVLDDTLIAGGDFTATHDDSIALSYVGAYSISDDTWRPIGAGLDDFAGTLEVDDVRSLVYAGGDFTAEAGGQPGSLMGVGVWDAVLREWIPFIFGSTPGEPGRRNGIDTLRAPYVSSLEADDSVVYVGGTFSDGIEEYPGTKNIAQWTWFEPHGTNTLTAAAGATVTLTGAGFIGMSPTDTVRFGSTPVTSMTRVSSTSLTVVVPPGTFTNAPIYVDAVGGRGQVGTFSSPGSPGPGPSPSLPPTAPRSVTAEPGDRQATISWSAPSSAGSFPVMSYEVRSSPAGGVCLATALTCTVTGLTNGTTYTFEARALNGAGWGPWSTPSNAVTPRAPEPPPPPITITITGSRGTGADRQVVTVRGTSTGLEGAQVRAHVRLQGQTDYRAGRLVEVSGAGRFEWQRTTGKKTNVFFTGRGAQSNRVVIPGARR